MRVSARKVSPLPQVSVKRKRFGGDRSAGGLCGAVTHSLFKRMSPKRMSPQRAADGYRALNEVLVGSD